MIQRINEQYYELGFNLLSGIVVDEALVGELEKIVGEAREKIQDLIKNNKKHILETRTAIAYPKGNQTSFNIAEPKGMFDISLKGRLHIMKEAFSVKKVPYLFKADKYDYDGSKAFAQRVIEDELDGKGGQK